MTIFEIKDYISISSAGFETSEESLRRGPTNTAAPKHRAS